MRHRPDSHPARARRAADPAGAAIDRRPPSSAGWPRFSQLGLVSLVYPAAHHTRFEHSLGVYRLALLYLRRLAHDERFAELVTPDDAELFIVAALLHDLGHWPFCHPIEDIRLPSVPEPRAVRQQLPAGRRNRRRAPRRLGHPTPRRRRAAVRKTPRPPRPTSPEHALRADRHRQDGLPLPRQPARRRALRSALRPAAADRQPVPEPTRRRPGDHRQGQNGRRDDGLRPLRHVQRGLLAPRRPRGHGHAAAGVLSAAWRSSISTPCFA